MQCIYFPYNSLLLYTGIYLPTNTYCCPTNLYSSRPIAVLVPAYASSSQQRGRHSVPTHLYSSLEHPLRASTLSDLRIPWAPTKPYFDATILASNSIVPPIIDMAILSMVIQITLHYKPFLAPVHVPSKYVPFTNTFS